MLKKSFKTEIMGTKYKIVPQKFYFNNKCVYKIYEILNESLDEVEELTYATIRNVYHTREDIKKIAEREIFGGGAIIKCADEFL